MSSAIFRSVIGTTRLVAKLGLGLIAGIYLVSVRSFLVVTATYLTLYFAMGSSFVRESIEALLSENIHGRVTMATLQWGPLPWSFRVADFRVLGTDDELLIRVPSAHVDLNLDRTVAQSLRSITSGQRMEIHIDQVRVEKGWTRVAFDRNGELSLERALGFSEPADMGQAQGISEAELGTPFIIHDAHLRDIDVDLVFPDGAINFTGLDVSGDLTYQSGSPLHLDASTAYARDVKAWLAGAVLPEPQPEALTLPLRGFRFEGVSVRDGTIGVDAIVASLHRGLLKGRGAFATGAELAWEFEADFDALPDEILPILSAGQVLGTLSGVVRGSGHDTESLLNFELILDDAEVEEFAVERALASGRWHSSSLPTQATPEQRLEFLRLEADLAGGRVSSNQASFVRRRVPLGQELPGSALEWQFSAALELDGVEPWQQGRHMGFGSRVLEFLAPNTRLDGGVSVEGRVHQGLGERVAFTALANGLEVNTGSEHGKDAVFGLDGHVQYRCFAPEIPPPKNDVISVVPGVAQPEESLRFDKLRLSHGNDQVTLDGGVDLQDGELSLDGSLDLEELGGLLALMGFAHLPGDIDVDALEIGGTLKDPIISARVRWANPVLAGVTMDSIRARLRFEDEWLELSDVSARGVFGQLSGAGRVRLGSVGNLLAASSYPFMISRLDLVNTPLEWFLGLRGISGIRGEVTLSGTQLEGVVPGAAESLVGDVDFDIKDLSAGSQDFSTVKGRVSATRDRLVVDGLAATFKTGHQLKGHGSVARQRGLLDAHLSTIKLPLNVIDALKGQGLGGAVGLDLDLSGSLQQPTVSGYVVFDKLRMGSLDVGDATLFLSPTGRPGESAVSAPTPFPRLVPQEGSRVEFTGWRPARVHLLAKIPTLSIAELVPELSFPEGELMTSGSLSVELLPGHARPVALHFEAQPGELEVRLFDREFQYKNQSPTQVIYDGVSWRLSQTSMGRDGQPHLGLCGSYEPEKGLALELSGALELGLLQLIGSVKETFSVMEGHLMVTASGAPRSSSRCTPRALGSVVTLGGALNNPVLDGEVEFRKLRLVPRRSGKEIHVDGSRVLLSSSSTRPGSQWLRVSERGRMLAQLDEGELELWGELEFQQLELASSRLFARGNDLSWKEPGEFELSFNPSLNLSLDDLLTSRPSMRLSGDIVCTEGRYYRSFDRFAQAVGIATGASQQMGASGAMTQHASWLSTLALDLNVTTPTYNIDVQSPFPFGRVDLDAKLDLKLRGTPNDLKLERRISFLEGGSVVYRVLGREFELVRGAVDFEGSVSRPRVDLEVRSEIEWYERRAGANEEGVERSVMLHVRVAGVMDEDLDIQMWSVPGGYDQADLKSLLLFGRPLVGAEASVADETLFSLDLSGYFDSLIKAPFDYDLTVGPTSDLRLDIETTIRFGRKLRLGIRAVQESAESTRVRAGFEYQIGDSVSLEASLNRNTGEQNSIPDAYEARVNFEIFRD